MSGARRAALVVLALAAGGCRTIHEGIIKQNLGLTRFAHTSFPFTSVQANLAGLARRPSEGWLWVSTDERTPEGWRWCLSERELHGCFLAHVKDGQATFTLEDAGAHELLRVFWTVIDRVGAEHAANPDEDDVPQLMIEEEEGFVPRWSFTAAGRSGVVTSFNEAVFTFGGQVGVRYWASTYLVPGFAVEVENAVFRVGSAVTIAPQARLELTVWRPENARFFNLPNISFLMAAEPLFSLGPHPAVGARAVLGVHLEHLGRYPTPFFFEAGYQSLTADGHDASGVRAAIGIGF